jgi:aryl-alcohol dehydrogenase
MAEISKPASFGSAHVGAVLGETGGDFAIEPICAGALAADEVAVRIVATGMCHTDLAVRSGLIPMAPPVLLGHEGAGIVIALGDAVRSLSVGDHVVLSFVSCGACPPCSSGHVSACDRFGALNFSGARPDGSHAMMRAGNAPLGDRFFGQSSFATLAIASERNAVRVRKDVPLARLGPLGCGVQTGAGAVLNSFAMPKGASFAVFGSGAVGLSAVMAARLAGASTIVAVDRVASRLSLARELGATHAIDAGSVDVVAEIMAIAPQGVDFSLDTTGRPEVIPDAVRVLRGGGTCGLVGATPRGATAPIDTNDLMRGSKRIVGIIEGDSDPQEFIPRLVDEHMAGHFPFDRLIAYFSLERINEAAEAAETGEVIKPVIIMPACEATGAPDVSPVMQNHQEV